MNPCEYDQLTAGRGNKLLHSRPLWADGVRLGTIEAWSNGSVGIVFRVAHIPDGLTLDPILPAGHRWRAVETIAECPAPPLPSNYADLTPRQKRSLRTTPWPAVRGALYSEPGQ